MRRLSSLLLIGSLILSSLALRAEAPEPLPDDPACTEIDREYMKRAVELAREAVEKGNSPFGAVLVADGKVVAEFTNAVATAHDPTRHAEIGLISTFAPKLDREVFRRATLYASSEPCVMCCGAILNAGIPTVVYGTTEAQFQRIIRDKASPNPLTSREIMARTGGVVTVRGPLMEKEGLAIHASYWPEMKKKWAAEKD